MNLELTEDQEFFRETTRRFLESEAPLTSVRALWDTTDGLRTRLVEQGGGARVDLPVRARGARRREPVRPSRPRRGHRGRGDGPDRGAGAVPAGERGLRRAGAVTAATSSRPSCFPGCSRARRSPRGRSPNAAARGTPRGCRSPPTPDGDAVVLSGEKAYVEAAGRGRPVPRDAVAPATASRRCSFPPTPTVSPSPVGAASTWCAATDRSLRRRARVPASTVVGDGRRRGRRGGAPARARARAAVRRDRRRGRPRVRVHHRVRAGSLCVRPADRVVPGAQAPDCRHARVARVLEGDQPTRPRTAVDGQDRRRRRAS